MHRLEDPRNREPLRSRLRRWVSRVDSAATWSPERTSRLIDRLMLLGFVLVFAMALYIFLLAR